MTLTEFLLARIAEDEAVAQAGEDDWDIPDGVTYTRVGLGADASWVHTVEPARLLAECEAKRRIVEAVAARDDSGAVSEGDRGASFVEQNVLRLLALPYADHPDYDEKWRI